MQTPTLAPSTQAVLDFIAATGGETSLPTAAIADQVPFSAPSVKVAIANLEDAGLIVVERRRRNRHAGDPAGRTLRIAGGAA